MTATPSFFKKYSEEDPLPVADETSGNLLGRIYQMLTSPLGYDKAQQRQRGTVIVESGTVTTVGSVLNLNGRNAEMLVNAGVNTAWALNVRARIT